MATVERKRITLHPVKEDGTVDTKVCLYPKTFIDGLIDRDGNEVEAAMQSSVDLVYTELNDEIVRAQAKENELDAKIDSAISDNLQAEISRATKAESEIIESTTAMVDNEATRATNVELSLQNKILNEKERAELAERALTAELNSEKERAIDRENTIETSLLNKLQKETARATNTETKLQTGIEQEKNRAENIETTLSEQILNIKNNYVTTDTNQIIEGEKVFADHLHTSDITLSNMSTISGTAIQKTSPITIHTFKLQGNSLLFNRSKGNVSSETVYSKDNIQYTPSFIDEKVTYTLNIPSKNGTIAVFEDIPTNYVTLDTEQTITGRKTFTDGIHANGMFGFTCDGYGIGASDALYIEGYKEITGESVFFDNIIIQPGIALKNSSNDRDKGLVLPNTAGWTIDKIIATVDDVELKADKNGPLPYYTAQANDNVLDYITTNNLADKPIVLAITSDNNTKIYSGIFNIRSGSKYKFEFEEIGTKLRYFGNSADVSTLAFSTIFSDTYKDEFELAANKVTTIDNDSTNAQYPSAKATYDYIEANKGTQLYSHLLNIVFTDNSELAIKFISSTKSTAVTIDSIIHGCDDVISILEIQNPNGNPDYFIANTFYYNEHNDSMLTFCGYDLTNNQAITFNKEVSSIIDRDHL